MLVPLTGFALLGKRLAQLSRRTDAVTMPDLLRGRFDSPAVGLATSLIILFFLTFMLMAQFKAGAIVMKLAWPGNAESTVTLAEDAGDRDRLRQYYIGLTIFTVVVVGYTLFGGFLGQRLDRSVSKRADGDRRERSCSCWRCSAAGGLENGHAQRRRQASIRSPPRRRRA